MAGVVSDVRYAVRGLRRRPGFTAVALLTLALGIGANAAVFSAVYGILLRPLPFHAPERLVSLNAEQFVSNAEMLFLREHARSLADVGAISPGWGVALTGTGEATQLNASRVSTNLLELLGVRPLLGRSFLPGESTPGNEHVALLGHALWAERFGSDPSVVGRSLVLDGEPITVVGVLPRGLGLLGRPADLWMPLVIDPAAWFHRGAVSHAVARLAPGVPVERARAEFAALAPRMREAFDYPPNHYASAVVVPLHQREVGNVRTALLVLLAAVGFIVLIAGANVANLLLMRAAGRRREIAVRTALGATRGRLTRQLLAESVVLALGGGALGVLLGVLGVRVLRGLLPADTPRVDAIALDPTVVGVCALVALSIGVLFGLAPALIASRGDVQGALRGGRGSTGNVAGARARGVLVVAEVALALVLVIGAGLMARTLWELSRVDTGFRGSNVLTLRVQPTGERYAGVERQTAYIAQVIDRVRALPGAGAVGAIHHLPLAGYAWYANVEVEGRPLAPGASPLRTGWRVIAGDYFQAMAIPLLGGRPFLPTDTQDRPPVAIVSEAFARVAWPGEDPIGKRFTAGNATRRGPATVVGVVGSVRHVSLDAAPEPEVYRPFAQGPMGAMTVVAATRGDPMALAAAAREAVRSIDANVPISDLRSLAEVMSRSVARPRLIMALLLGFAAVGVLLGAVGIYGVIAYAVSERRREIGIRIALGADPRRVAGGVLAHGVRYAALGVAIGLTGAIAVTRLMRSLLFGVSATEPVTLAALSLGVIGVAALASYLPARQAARVDPVETLRDE